MHELTDEQNVFMETTGKTILCACPSSGKTYVVAKKVEKIIKTWESNHQGIAMLSFTNVASEQVKEQL